MSIPLHAYSCEECNSTARSASSALYIDRPRLTNSFNQCLGISSAGVPSANPPRQLALATNLLMSHFCQRNMNPSPRLLIFPEISQQDRLIAVLSRAMAKSGLSDLSAATAGPCARDGFHIVPCTQTDQQLKQQIKGTQLLMVLLTARISLMGSVCRSLRGIVRYWLRLTNSRAVTRRIGDSRMKAEALIAYRQQQQQHITRSPQLEGAEAIRHHIDRCRDGSFWLLHPAFGPRQGRALVASGGMTGEQTYRCTQINIIGHRGIWA